ncbi:MAG: CRISPR-associated helicase Cas3' [Desulfarculus sp.]|nr:CRISPR-associated helicase Cas3' [Desulfarculus sp.]
MAFEPAIAHFRNGHDGRLILHALEDHLQGVALLASGFARVFKAADAAFRAGLWHDLGKYSTDFQEMLSRAQAQGPDAALEGPGRVNHSSAGAIWADQTLGGLGRLLAFTIAGHHAGLPDYINAETPQAQLRARLRQTDLLAAAQAGGIPPAIMEPPETHCPASPPGESDLWVRMLFSCLVDADYLDTEAFMQPEQADRRGGHPGLAELHARLTAHLDRLAANSRHGEVNQLRAEVLGQCLAASGLPPGVFTLSVPTGGGKTLSSLAFALRHAMEHGLERVIYVIPYTSIIEQTAGVFRGIFGEGVLEHHSNLDPERDSYANQLASENWDAPLIVTTTVQFFESLFATRPGRCRKLHRIAGSVVVLDEAQLLPPEFLQPILRALAQLAEHYRVSPVVCTATQPAWEPINTMDMRFTGLPGGRELVRDPMQLHRRLKRVRVRLPGDLNAWTPWEELAQRLEAEESALCIVNTRAHARLLSGLLPRAWHLSAAMCAQHRSEVIAAIKQRLHDKLPTVVISTQLVECGVDFSFPVVYRALAGLDSIAQAAGRCNREGELLPALGRVEVFVPPDPPPKGHLRQAAECARRILASRPPDPLAPELFTRYFRDLYWLKGSGLDKYGIVSLLRDGKFRAAAQLFRLIPEDGPPVLVWHGQGLRLIQRLRHDGPSRDLLRRLQRHAVSVPARVSEQWLDQGLLEKLPQGHLAQAAPGLYDPRHGLGDTEAAWRAEDLVVAS